MSPSKDKLQLNVKIDKELGRQMKLAAISARMGYAEWLEMVLRKVLKLEDHEVDAE